MSQKWNKLGFWSIATTLDIQYKHYHAIFVVDSYQLDPIGLYIIKKIGIMFSLNRYLHSCSIPNSIELAIYMQPQKESTKVIKYTRLSYIFVLKD